MVGLKIMMMNFVNVQQTSMIVMMIVEEVRILVVMMCAVVVKVVLNAPLFKLIGKILMEMILVREI